MGVWHGPSELEEIHPGRSCAYGASYEANTHGSRPQIDHNRSLLEHLPRLNATPAYTTKALRLRVLSCLNK